MDRSPAVKGPIPVSANTEQAVQSGTAKNFKISTEIFSILELGSQKIGAKIFSLLSFSSNTAISSLEYDSTNATAFTNAQKAVDKCRTNEFGSVHHSIQFKEGINSKEKFDEITKIAFHETEDGKLEYKDTLKSKRPDPKTYLDAGFIKSHLDRFEGGAVSFIRSDMFDDYTIRMNKMHGRTDGMFVMPLNFVKDVVKKTGGDMGKIEEKMGIDKGYWNNGKDKLLAIVIKNPGVHNLRVVKGTESGANINWRPGGVTSGGVPEAMVDGLHLDYGTPVPISALLDDADLSWINGELLPDQKEIAKEEGKQ